MKTPALERDADRARRLITGLNDEQSIRTLRKYLEEIEAQLSATRMLNGTERHG